MDPNLPFYRPATMKQIVTDARSRMTFALTILIAGTAATLLLGVVGLYSVIAYAVSLRTREIGIRIALGLTPGEAARMILRQSGRIVLAGVGAGIVAFMLFARLLESLTFEVSATDAVALAAAVSAVLAIGGLATWVPALRAARIDPVDALRAD